MNLDRNIVIEASAGTGKTYTLVQTILQALFQKNLAMESLVALTFTKKAAGEMKERIALELQKIDVATEMQQKWREWGQPLQELKERARYGLETIDRAAIGTIHSYAFSLLKRFPLSAGISPDSEVDEKNVRYDEIFEEEWGTWLKIQLSPQSSALSTQEEWLEVLERVSLGEVRSLARRLCDFDVPLENLPLSDENLKEAIKPFYQEARQFAATKPQGVKSTKMAQACEEILAGGEVGKDIVAILDDTPTGTKDWSSEDISRLKVLKAVALNLLNKGDRTLALLTKLLKPFIITFRGRLLAEGCLTNNALLVLARDLVARDLEARRDLKHFIRLIFIDEFQDTDPLQGELLLFLAEQRATLAKRWQDVQLEPGKLFIVGDPKQSIYRFRGADIGAYKQITGMVLEQGGVRHTLEESYRSHDQIIHAVNAAFEPLIQEQHPISPGYQALIPRRVKSDPDRHNVELRLVTNNEPLGSDEALEMEAKDAAAWIAHHTAPVSGSEFLETTRNHKPETRNALRYKDVALIFRSTPAMTPFIDALRAAEIPYVVEGERYFYRTPEVTDVLNLLHVIDDPANRIALAGYLRSPLGGFTDAELALLQAKNGLELYKPLPKELDGAAHHGAWERLKGLHAKVRREPLKRILMHVYEDTYLLELAARSYHRDQTIANLFKLKRLMESFAEEGETTLRGLLEKIGRFMEDDRLEGESPLADETYDAVRLLTIHKAKGLEYPVVWLPGLHRGRQGTRTSDEITVRYDWDTKQLGLSLGRKARNIADFTLEENVKKREAAEELRVLYVAMTRARDHLILSGGIKLKQSGRDNFLAQLAGAWDQDFAKLDPGEIKVGETTITLNNITDIQPPEPVSKEKKNWLGNLDLSALAKKWNEREKECEKAEEKRLVVTPSSLSSSPAAPSRGSMFNVDSPLKTAENDKGGVLLGTLVHRFLESWDFSCEKCDMPARLRAVANTFFAELGLLKSPFPNPKEGDGTDNPDDLKQTVEEAQRLLADFIGSDAEEEIKSSKIIGREVPFFYELNGALMRGAMDILYRTKDGQLVIGDYKSGLRTEYSGLSKDKNSALSPQSSELQYAAQGAAYVEAVSRALGEKAVFKLIYLREDSAALPRK
jgi:ATP-dependent helicase/nuclease subunit A